VYLRIRREPPGCDQRVLRARLRHQVIKQVAGVIWGRRSRETRAITATYIRCQRKLTHQQQATDQPLTIDVS
jgi:hypothetical protein